MDKYRRNFWNSLGFDGFTQITAYAHYTEYQPNAFFIAPSLYFGDGVGYAGVNSFAREDKIIFSWEETCNF